MTKTHLLLSMNNIRLTNAHNCFQKKRNIATKISLLNCKLDNKMLLRKIPRKYYKNTKREHQEKKLKRHTHTHKQGV